MVSWIPFRAQTLTDSLIMYSKILNPSELVGLNLRENTYLVAAAMVLVIVATWFGNTHIQPWLEKRPKIAAPILLAQYTVAILFVFIFLRPINQFIYFQF